MSDFSRKAQFSRRFRMLAGLAALAAVLTACGGIPRDSGVQVGQPAEAGDNPAPVFLPSGPQTGADQESILRGFIDAASSPQGNYAVAREFLTPDFSDGWDPDAGVTIDDGSSRSVNPLSASAMQFSVTPVAAVNATGQYEEFDSRVPVPLPYEFAMIDDEWRISEAPNGTVVDASTFASVFSAQALYFFDPGFDYLVPDLRWYPRGASGATRIVKGLLAGPSPWLLGAVTTAFPEGTALTADAVQVVARDAKIDLNSEALNADTVTLQRMRAQLVNSLSPGTSVTISINDNVQDAGELGAAAPIVKPRVDARALILRDGEFGFLAATGTDISPVTGLSESIVGLTPSAVTLAPDQERAAVRNADGVWEVNAGDDATQLDPRDGLVAPAIDGYGYIWSVPTTRPGELFAYSPSGEAIAVPTPWQEATSIQAIAISRDGTRLIAIWTVGTETRFVVAAIKREKTAPVALGEPVYLAAEEGVPQGVAWVDELTVAALSTTPDGESVIATQRIGGVSDDLESAPGTVTITGGNTLRELRALTGAGVLAVQRGVVGWQERVDKVVLVATQQGVPR